MSIKKMVFISHSTVDRAIAMKICQIFEKQGLSCWIAPRDVPAGGRYPGEISKAIDTCKAFVLIFSSNAMKSRPVLAELDIAFTKVPLFPLKIDNVEPNHDFRYFLGTSQWCEVTDFGTEAVISQVAKAILESINRGHTVSATAAQSLSIASLIDSCVYPVAMVLNDVQDQQIANNSDGYDNAVFRLVETVVRFSVFCLISALHSSQKKVLNRNKIAEFAEFISFPKLSNGVQLLRYFIATSGEATPHPVIGTFLDFIKNPPGSLVPIQLAGDRLGHSLSTAASVSSGNCIIDFLDVIDMYINEYRHNGLRIRENSDLIKDGIVQFIEQAGGFFFQQLYAFSETPGGSPGNSNEKTWINFRGITPKGKSKLPKDGSVKIQYGHTYLFAATTPENYLDLYPFIVSSDNGTDLQIWLKSDKLTTVVYERMRDRMSCESGINFSDDFVKLIIGIDEPELFRVNAGATKETVKRIILETESCIRQNVHNMICKTELMGRINSIREHFEASDEFGTPCVPELWIEKLNVIQKEASSGFYARLLPTDREYLLTDENGGKYVISDKFIIEHKNEIKDFDMLQKMVGKGISNDVKVALLLAIEESMRGNMFAVLGVEHLCIGLSKLCNQFIFGWYNAIQVFPKHHRDIIRYSIESIAPAQTDIQGEQFGNIIMKQRLRTVFSMSVKEVNLAKRETIGIKDILSAILREGYSLPVIILTEVFGFTRDHLMAEFYHLLRKNI